MSIEYRFLTALKFLLNFYSSTKLFIRYAKTLFETEDAFQERKHILAASIQATWKCHVQQRQYQRMRCATIVIQCWVRRFLAQRLAKRRQRAANVIRKYVCTDT